MSEATHELPNKALLRPDEVAPFLRVSLSTVYRMKDEGALEAKKIRGAIRITRESVVSFLENQ
jgi:excisionase family DNA binding protein